MLFIAPAPLFYDNPGFGQATEDFSIEAFTAERAVETLVATVLPRFLRGDGDTHRLSIDRGSKSLAYSANNGST